MNPTTLKQIADAHYQLADLYLQLAGEDASAPVSAARPAAAATPPAAAPASFDSAEFDLPPDEGIRNLPAGDQGSLAQCPKHRTNYLPSKFKEGEFYCPSDSDEAGWTNRKGKCQITPKSAPIWLRQHAGAAA